MIVVAGESLVDLIIRQGERVGGSYPCDALVGGSPYNCARVVARLGGSSGYLCPMSSDSFGALLCGQLAADNVHILLEQHTELPTSIAAVTLDAAGNSSYRFYREGVADRAIEVDTAIAALPEKIDFYQTGGFCPLEAEDAGKWLPIMDAARARGAMISVDPNLRPSLINDLAGYLARLDQFLSRAQIIKVSDEDLALMDGALSIEQHIERLLGQPETGLVVVTLGDDGAIARTKFGAGSAPVYPPENFVDTVGAGDSLMGAILVWLGEHGATSLAALDGLSDDQLNEMLKFGTLVAGLNCGQSGCNPPKRAEVDALL